MFNPTYNSMSDDVMEFQAKAEQLPLYNTVSVPEVATLYLTLIEEEYNELREAIDNGHDNEHLLKESLDLIWVTLGYLNAKGFNVDGAWHALAQANMRKLQKDSVTGKLLRHPNGKIKKPEGWKDADYSQFLSFKNTKGGLR